MSIQDDYYDIKNFLLENDHDLVLIKFNRFAEFAFQQERDADTFGDQVRAVREFAKVLKDLVADD